MRWNEREGKRNTYSMSSVDSEDIIYSVELTGAGMWSKVVGRGKTMRIEDLKGGANVGMLLFNAYEKQERYNMPDTLKGQQIFFLSSPGYQ